MSSALVLGLGIATTASVAHAERAIVVEVPAAAPFDADELRRAIRMRVAPDGGPVHVRVTLRADGLQIAVPAIDDDGVRDVDVAGLRGPAAARLVALAASDLLLDDLALVPSTHASKRAVTVAAGGGVGVWDSMLGGAMLDATYGTGTRLVALELGAAKLLDGGELAMTAVTARLGAGIRADIVELRAGLTVIPLSVAAGAGDSTVLVGGGASLRLRLPVAPRVRAVFAVGADVFVTQTEYVALESTVMVTPRIAPWLGAGIEVTP